MRTCSNVLRRSNRETTVCVNGSKCLQGASIHNCPTSKRKNLHRTWKSSCVQPCFATSIGPPITGACASAPSNLKHPVSRSTDDHVPVSCFLESRVRLHPKHRLRY